MDGWAVVEQVAGTALMAFVLADVFLTVLYARLGSQGASRLGAGVIGIHIARGIRRLFLAAPNRMPHRDGLLSFCGPASVLLMFIAWSWGLAIGAALVLHPHLGDSIRTSQEPTPSDFVSALYAAGTSLAVTGSSDFNPATRGMRLLYLMNSIAGTSVFTFGVSYLMQIYTALKLRNSLALEVELASAKKGDAAELIAALAPNGDWSIGANTLAAFGARLVELKEAHHFYPLLFYFRAANVCFASSRLLLVALDTVTLVRSAVREDIGTRIAAGASMQQLWRGGILMADTLEGTFLRRPDPPEYHVDGEMEERWRARYFAGRERLRLAGIALREDAEEGARRYLALRREWQRHIEDLGGYMGFRPEEVDPALYR